MDNEESKTMSYYMKLIERIYSIKIQLCEAHLPANISEIKLSPEQYVELVNSPEIKSIVSIGDWDNYNLKLHNIKITIDPKVNGEEICLKLP